MPDIHLAIEEMVAAGDKIAWRMVATGTQTGVLFGFPATGKAARVGGIVLSHFQDGLWAEDHAQWDMFGMLQQLGLIPAPAGVGV